MKRPSRILVIGTDTALAYLIGRYAEQSGWGMTTMRTVPSVGEVRSLQPSALFFLSFENLGAAQCLLSDLGSCDIPVLVCSSVTDDARARELGADHCLVHPLTYDSFLAALATTKVP
jgi:DNA-binding response OmpR family regulator